MTITRIELDVSEHTDRGLRVVRSFGPLGRPFAAVGLSLLWPGFGHAFLGRTATAVGYVTAMVLLVVLSVLPGFWRVTVPLWGLLVVAAAVTSFRTARRAAPAVEGEGVEVPGVEG